MYDTMISITIVAMYGLVFAELAYHVYHMYKLWLDDLPMMDYIIPYDPILKSARMRDGSDWAIAGFLRLISTALLPILAGLLWPLTLTIGVFIVFAKYQKYHRTITKALEKAKEQE